MTAPTVFNPLLQAALAYAQSGWFVFPVEAPHFGDDTSGKRPLGSLVPNGKDDATTDLDTIRRWWHSAPNANIGIAVAKSGLLVLDVDIGKGKAGRESLQALDSDLTRTLTAVTGSGGLHAFYGRPEGEAIQRIGAMPGIDLIGNGYVIAAPSAHYTGGTYAWQDYTTIALCPPVLVSLKRAPLSKAPREELGNTPLAEGGRNNLLWKLAAALRSNGLGVDALRAALHLENRRRCTPPLPDTEIEALAASAINRVEVTRDAATSALADDIRDLFSNDAPQDTGAIWARDLALIDRPPYRFYSTPSLQLDTMLGGGLATQQVFGVIGPPSVGKSAFVGCMARWISKTIPVLHVSTELPRFELLIRYAAEEHGFPWRDALKGGHRDAVRATAEGLRMKLLGSDELDMVDPIGQIAREACILRDETPDRVPPLIVVDYVQLLARGAGDQTRAKVGDLTMKLRKLSQILDCPIIAVFSTARDFYNGDKRDKMRTINDPTAYLGAAKESGDIEFDCATVVFLDVDQLTQDPEGNPARVVVARCRQGSVGFAGYRAQLAAGRWVPDPLAAAAMQTENRKAKAIEEKRTDIETRVLNFVIAHPGSTMKEIRERSGVDANKCNMIIGLLCDGGMVEEYTKEYYDARQAQKHCRAYRVTNKAATDGVATPEVKP